MSKISLIVPFLNEEENVEAFVKCIEAQTLAPLEIIFVDSGSFDGTVRLLKELVLPQTQVHVVVNNSMDVFYPGKSRNIGINLAKGDLIAFMDMGISFDSCWLQYGYESLKNSELDGIISQCHFSSDGLISRSINAITNGVNSTSSCLPGSIFKKEVFKKTGLFPEHLRSAEDLIWRNNFRNFYNEVFMDVNCLSYRSYPNNLFLAISKWFTYASNSLISGLYFKQFFLYIIFFASLLASFFFNFKLGLICLLVYLFLRGFVDPIRRSKNIFWFKGEFLSLFVVIPLVLILDISKLLGFFYGLMKVLFPPRLKNYQRPD